MSQKLITLYNDYWCTFITISGYKWGAFLLNAKLSPNLVCYLCVCMHVCDLCAHIYCAHVGIWHVYVYVLRTCVRMYVCALNQTL